MFIDIFTAVFNLAALITSIIALVQIQGLKNRIGTNLNSLPLKNQYSNLPNLSADSVIKNDTVETPPLSGDQLGCKPRVNPPLPPILSYKERSEKRENVGESFVGKTMLSVLSIVMIAIGAICLGALAGNAVKVLFIFLAGAGIIAFGLTGDNSSFKTTLTACGEVLVTISIILAGITYRLFPNGVMLLFSVLSAGAFYLIGMKRNSVVLRFSANIGLLVTSFFFTFIYNINAISPLGDSSIFLSSSIIAVISILFSCFGKEKYREVNMLISDLIVYIAYAHSPNSLWIPIVFAILQVAGMIYFKLSDSNDIYSVIHSFMWLLFNFVLVYNFFNDNYTFGAIYTAVILILFFASLKVTNLIKDNDSTIASVCAFVSVFLPVTVRYAFDKGFLWHIFDTNFNYYALLLFGIPAICFFLCSTKERNKTYTVISGVMFAMLAAVVPYSKSNWGWFGEAALCLSVTGCDFWAIGTTLTFFLLNFALWRRKEQNVVFSIISVIGAYASVCYSDANYLAIFTAVITIIVTIAQYYVWDFNLIIYGITLVFNASVFGVMIGNSSDVLSVILFVMAQIPSFFVIKRTLDTGKGYLWIITLTRLSVYITGLSCTLGLDFVGFAVSTILLVVSAIIVISGFVFNIKTVRLFGLTELIVIVLKMSIVDIMSASSITRVLMFIGGGLVCLGISAMYGKYDKLINSSAKTE